MENWKKYVKDWGIGEQEERYMEEQYKNSKLLKINFPDFWFNAYRNKNNFYKHVFLEAKEYVNKGVCGKEWLKEDRFQELWHRHCDFCLKEIKTDSQGECYCTKDIQHWICPDCYNAYKYHFGFQAEEVEDISSESISNIIGIIVSSQDKRDR